MYIGAKKTLASAPQVDVSALVAEVRYLGAYGVVITILFILTSVLLAVVLFRKRMGS